MRIDRRKLGRHYASLTDEELLSINREDLTETAQVIYGEEIARRGLEKKLAEEEASETKIQHLRGINDLLDSGHTEPEWLENAVCACSFVISPGKNSEEKASLAQTTLQKAGIPGHLTMVHETYDNGDLEQDIIKLMVPIAQAFNASSILERDLFNAEYEPEWRSQLGVLSDEDLLALDPNIFCAGILDIITRMNRAYAEEMAKRGLKARELRNRC